MKAPVVQTGASQTGSLAAITALKTQQLKLNAKIQKIESAERIAANKHLLGKCFRYRNTYGNDKGWWLYVMVTKAAYHLEVTSFQKTSTKSYDIRTHECHSSLGGGYLPITRAQFNKEWRKLSMELISIV